MAEVVAAPRVHTSNVRLDLGGLPPSGHHDGPDTYDNPSTVLRYSRPYQSS